MLNTEDIAHQIAVRSGMSEGDMLNILRTLADIIADALSNGDSVRLARIGILSAGLTSEAGADTLEELRHLPKDTTVNFRAASELRTALANAGDTFTGDVTDLQSG